MPVRLNTFRKMLENAGVEWAYTVLKRLREAGDLPLGKPGRGGSGSAEITPRVAAAIVLAVSVPVEPIDAPTEARILSNFACIGMPSRRLIDALTEDLVEAGASSPCWTITRYYADRHTVDGKEPQIFVGDIAGNGLPLAIRRTIIAGRFISDLALLFRPSVGSA